MSKLIISKKGRAPKPLLISGLVILLSGVMLLAAGEGTSHGWGNSEFEDIMQGALPFLVFFFGALVVLAATHAGKSKISVYDDHIEGVGVGKAMLGSFNFHFTKDMRYTVQQSGGTLKISCGNESYNVILSAADANQVYQCVNRGTTPQSAPRPTYTQKPTQQPKPAQQPTASDKKIEICPNCRAQLRIPVGKGRIRVTCPKCKNSFQVNS